MKRTLTFSVLVLVAAALWAGGQRQPTTAGSLPGFNATGLPIVDEPYTLTVASRIDTTLYPDGFENLQMMQEWSRDTNVNIEWTLFDMASWTEKKNLLLATASTLPDVFLSQLVESDILTYAPQGYWVPLEDLIQDYAPNLRAVFNEHPGIYRSLFSPDGHLYSLPRYKGEPSMLYPNRMFINEQWLDRLGLGMPDTLDEFWDVLVAFRDRDPNGNGRQDEIPLAFLYNENQSRRTNTGQYRFGLFGFFGTFGRIDTPDHAVIENGQIVFTADKQEYRAAVEWLRRAYQERLIDPEAFTMDTATFKAKNTSGDYVYGVRTGWTAQETAVDLTNYATTHVTMPPLTNVNGEKIWPRFTYNQYQMGYFSITKDAKHPEVAIRWIDYMIDPTLSVQHDWGMEGLGTKFNPDGTWEVIRFGTEVRTAEGMAWLVPTMVPPATYMKRIITDPVQVQEAAGPDVYESHAVEVPPNLWFPLEIQDEFNQLNTDIQSYVYRTTAKWVVEGGIEREWDTYRQTLNRMGLARWLELYNQAYALMTN